MHMAAWNGHTHAVRLLFVNNRSSVHAKDKVGARAKPDYSFAHSFFYLFTVQRI